MRIVVLDGYMLNPGDLAWKGLEALGEVVVFPRTGPEAIVERLLEADAALTNKARITAADMAGLPRLRYIGVLATGYNNVDVSAAKEHGIVVTNVPAYSTDSVAQLAFALLLELTLQAGQHSQAVHRGDWEASPDFSFRVAPLIELAGKTMGIIGYGRIGQCTARIASAFGMHVLSSGRPGMNLVDAQGIAEPVTLDGLLVRSDVVCLHCPLTPETAGMINRKTLAKMKPGSFLINTSRGGLLDEAAVAEALGAGHLGGAGLDVLSTEPPAGDNPLLSAARCIITPHIGWATLEARERLLREVEANLRAFRDGHPVNVISH